MDEKNKKKLLIGAGAAGAGLIGFGLYELLKGHRPPPQPEGITLSNLLITPTTVAPGETVTISVLATNHTASPVSTIITLGGDVSGTQAVTIGADSSQTVTFTATPTAEGSYRVTVDGLSGTFLCTSQPHGDIVFSDLVVSPSTCIQGETVAISVTATNAGAVHEVMVVAIQGIGDRYNDTWQQSHQIGLDPGESKIVSFTFRPTVAETYTFTIASLSATLVVNPSPDWPGWTPGTVVYQITPTPDVVYLGQAVNIGVYIMGPWPAEYPMDLQATINVDGTTLSKVFNIRFRNPTLLFAFTPTQVGEYTVTAQDKTATFTVLEGGTGTYYSPFADGRLPVAIDVIVPDVPAFTTYYGAGEFNWPGGDLKFSDLPLGLRWGGSGWFLFMLGYDTNRILIGLLPNTQPIWDPADSSVTVFTSEVGLWQGSHPWVRVTPTEYTCRQYYDSKDELAEKSIVPHIQVSCHNSPPECRYRLTCPYCGWVQDTSWISSEGSFDKLSFARSFLQHIETEHPDHPLTEPAWY